MSAHHCRGWVGGLGLCCLLIFVQLTCGYKTLGPAKWRAMLLCMVGRYYPFLYGTYSYPSFKNDVFKRNTSQDDLAIWLFHHNDSNCFLSVISTIPKDMF